MNYTALIGNPTDHSVSYMLYDELAKAAQLPGFYQHIRLDIGADDLKKSIAAFNTLNFVGLNVTLPYKLDVMAHLDVLDPVIDVLGAVNTITLGETTTGYNTDWIGIAESVKQFGGHDSYDTAVIFGTGGAARAAIYACKQLGVKDIRVIYRVEASANTRKLQQASTKLGITLHPYTELAQLLQDAYLVINTTSAGMVGKDPLPFDLRMIDGVDLTGKVFLDAVFNPLQTPLLAYFQSHGAVVIDGLWMMIYQGVGALSIWFDRNITVDISDLKKIHGLLKKELQHA
jgi:shikimate dehydrogenase